MKLIITYYLLFICCSCTTKVQPGENFDIITVEEFENRYNSEKKLETIKITSTEQVYKLHMPVSETIDTSLRKYTYQSDSLYSVCETNELNKDKTKTTYYTAKSKEVITLRNKDTVEYSLERYVDNKKEKPEYKRIMIRVTGEPVINFTINDNYEEHYYYKDGHKIKKIRHDFNRNQITETYFFNDIPYQQALQSVPKSKNKQVIVCYTDSHINDTLIEKTFINGSISQITKTYKNNDKKIEHTSTSDGDEIINIGYKEGDLDITVSNTNLPSMGNFTDSTYIKNGKTIREVHISDDSKYQTTYDYDQYGNIAKKVTKRKLYNLN